MVLVTGASGHIGANLVRALIQEKRIERVFVHKNTRGAEELDVDIFKGDQLSCFFREKMINFPLATSSKKCFQLIQVPLSFSLLFGYCSWSYPNYFIIH
ncbi:MAG: NAD-dependent epimerase/dehydratase family protein [Candidatus Aminicenantaceae bacterium]